ncbi:MAG: four helix bundle protein [Candidatus Pacebacteria bacterium]|nr:four helix bundle protein [Candidatus Paceibacterota bacterium]
MQQKSSGAFHQKLSENIDRFVYGVYEVTQAFPRDEVFGATSQLRRSALSVALNYTEGYARHGKNELGHFLKISYASLKEALYIVRFANKRKWLSDNDAKKLELLGDSIGKMLWPIFSRS